MKIFTDLSLIATALTVSLAVTSFSLIMTPRDPLAAFESGATANDFAQQRSTGLAKIPRVWQMVASGESYSYGREPVQRTVSRSATRTFGIQLPGILLGWFAGATLGIFLGANQGRLVAAGIHATLFLAILVPYPVVIATARMLLLDTGLFHIGLNEHGFGAYVPAVLTTAFVLIPVTALHQSGVAAVAWVSDEAVFARAIGMPLSVRIRIALQRSGAYWRSQFALLLAASVQGSVMLEHVFHVNGIGAAAFAATSRGDACLLLLIVTLTSVLTAVGLLWTIRRYSSPVPTISER